ncbi:MAG: ABC transporter ATP-binding protein [Dactylosporangium sp.]|nr:ABC transporter ATP-binding protein [Dactylosporangium sp.]NNJ61390.1 ABC transporter ATP-binding protein [Dactylosporangium sp.]
MIESDLSPRGLAALAPALLLIAVMLLAGLLDIWRGPRPRHLPRAVWTAAVLASFPWGLLAYLFLGRAEARTAEPGTAGRAGPGGPVARTLSPPGYAVADPVVRTTGLVREYGRGTGVCGVDLALARRGVYGLVGPNGSGKTTLIGLIAGTRRPDAGRVDRAFSPERLALCPDTPVFESWLAPREIVDLARRMIAPHRPASATAEVLAEVGLTSVAGRRVGGFSRGMTQRVGLAVALVTDPELIIMDEPAATLDPAGRADLIALLGRLGERLAILLSSHDLGQIQRAATAVGVLHRGRLVYQGPTADLVRHDPGGHDPGGHDLERAFLALTGTERPVCVG